MEVTYQSFPGDTVGLQAALSQVSINAIYTAGHDFPLYASRRSYFDLPTAQVRSASPWLPSTLPVGFEEMNTQHLLIPSLMHLVGRLDTVVPEDISAMARPDEIQQALIDWQVEDVTATTYCPTRTALEDEALHQVYLHMRLAALAVCGFIRFSMNTTAHEFL